MRSEARVIVNQLGFRNGDRLQRVILNDVPGDRGIRGACIVSASELNGVSMYALNDPNQ